MEDTNTEAFAELEHSIHSALETYSNVHRGSGHFSMVTTHLFDKARDIIIDYMLLDKARDTVIFCTPRREKKLMALLKAGSYKSLSSEDLGLHLGVRALAVKKRSLPSGVPFQSGGGTTKLVSRDWVLWADAPDRFEAGTPAIINIIAFAKALLMTGKHGKEIFRTVDHEKVSLNEILYKDELEKFQGDELLSELRKSIIGHNTIVPTATGSVTYVNLDNAASTSTFESVFNSFCMGFKQPMEAKIEIANEVKSICSEFLGAPVDKYEVIFTSNTTEGINLVSDSLSRASSDKSELVILNTLLEHNSNDLPWRTLPDSSLIRLQIDNEGFIDVAELEKILTDYNRDQKYGNKRIKLVAISGASNVLGSFNDLEKISSISHQYGAQLLVDASQLVAHRKVEIENTGIDYLAFCAHKTYAPFGTGVLVVKKGLLSFSQDEIEQINASGEENIGGIAALGKALILLKLVGLERIKMEENQLTSRALTGLGGIPGIKVFGIKDPGSPRFELKGGVIPFFVKGKMPTGVAREFAEQGGIGIRHGCHCAHMLVKRILNVPPALEGFQRIIARIFPGIVFPGVARISLGIGNTGEDIDRMINVLGRISGSSRDARTQVFPEAEADNSISRKDLRKLLDEFKNEAARKVYYSEVPD